jgi:uncharacterized membrane protein YkvA (DUF1232 family)
VKIRWRKWFSRKRRDAARLVRDPEDALREADRAHEKATRNRSRLTAVWEDLQTMIRLVRAWARREYRGVSWRTLVLILGALGYFISPIDAILDAIPFAGLLDDAAVIGFVLHEVRAELEIFRAWEAQRRGAPALPAADQPRLA